MPREALAVSAIAASGVWLRFGQDPGVTVGACLSLALVALQMLRARAFVTPSRIIQERGLFLTTRSEQRAF